MWLWKGSWTKNKKYLKAAATDTRYFARSKLFESLVHKKSFGLIWRVVFKLGYLFCQGRQDTTFEFQWTRKKVASDNYCRWICKQAIMKPIMEQIQIDTHFNFPLISCWYWCWKILFHVELKYLINNFYFFSVLSQNYNTNVLYVCIIVPWFHEHIFKINWTTISQRCQLSLRPNIFFKYIVWFIKVQARLFMICCQLSVFSK